MKAIRVVPITGRGSLNSSDSGNKCKKAEPMRAPAERATKSKRKRWSLARLRDRVRTPMREPALISRLARTIWIKTGINRR